MALRGVWGSCVACMGTNRHVQIPIGHPVLCVSCGDPHPTQGSPKRGDCDARRHKGATVGRVKAVHAAGITDRRILKPGVDPQRQELWFCPACFTYHTKRTKGRAPTYVAPGPAAVPGAPPPQPPPPVAPAPPAIVPPEAPVPGDVVMGNAERDEVNVPPGEEGAMEVDGEDNDEGEGAVVPGLAVGPAVVAAESSDDEQDEEEEGKRDDEGEGAEMEEGDSSDEEEEDGILGALAPLLAMIDQEGNLPRSRRKRLAVLTARGRNNSQLFSTVMPGVKIIATALRIMCEKVCYVACVCFMCVVCGCSSE